MLGALFFDPFSAHMPCEKLPKMRPAKYTGPRRIKAHSAILPIQYNVGFRDGYEITSIVAIVPIEINRTRHKPANLASRKPDAKVITTRRICTSGIFNMMLLPTLT